MTLANNFFANSDVILLVSEDCFPFFKEDQCKTLISASYFFKLKKSEGMKIHY